MEREKIELLAPAGNFEKLKTALRFGADAVYVGGKEFSLRAFADNFSAEELKAAVEYTHSCGKKIYVATNIYLREGDAERLGAYFSFLQSIGADAALVSDPGAVWIARQAAPDLPLHLSTQANTTNAYAAKFWQGCGISRVVLARELSLREIEAIHASCPQMELEAFVHGAMCISYSGRCLLSDYLDGRSSNRGACVQACRWGYELRPVSPAEREESLPVEEDKRGTYILNSKDLNMIAHLDRLRDAGVRSFKIEGRMKSGYYLATVVNAYRRALDGAPIGRCAEELDTVAHRAYITAYAFGENHETVNYDNAQTKGTCEYIADVLGWENGRLTVEMRNRFYTGDELEVLSPDGFFGRKVCVFDLRGEDGERVDDAKLVQGKYSFLSDMPLSKGDFLRRRR